MTALEKFREFADRENAAMRANLEPEFHPNSLRACPKAALRRAKVAELKAQGVTLVEIAVQVGATLSTVKSDSARLG